MIDQDDLCAFAEWITQVIPLLAKYEPPGFVDFRGGVPRDYRAGLFFKMAQWTLRDEIEDPVQFKGIFGCCKNAVDAAASASALFGVSAEVSPPHHEIVEYDGVDHRTVYGFWDIRFNVPQQRLESLAYWRRPFTEADDSATAMAAMVIRLRECMRNISVGAKMNRLGVYPEWLQWIKEADDAYEATKHL